MPTFQEVILRLQNFWDKQGCALLQPYDIEVGGLSSMNDLIQSLYRMQNEIEKMRSGSYEWPSRADEALTHTLKAALALVDVRVLDHIIVAPGAALSMAEKGLI